MGTPGWLQLAVFAAVVAALTKPLGGYLYSVLEGPTGPMPRLERALYRLCAVDGQEQTWQQYAVALLSSVSSACSSCTRSSASRPCCR